MSRTTNAELGERLAKIEGHLEHMATKEQLAELRRDVRAIERSLPTYEEAANRTDIAKGRQLQKTDDERDHRSAFAIATSFIAVIIAAVSAWWEVGQ